MAIELSMKQRGVITLLGGFLIMIVTGSVFLWGQLNVYITSYFRQKNDQGLELSVGGAILPVMMASLATGIPLGIKGIKFFGSARISCIISTIIASCMVFISSYTEKFWQFILIYGVINGIAQGSIYFVPIYMGYLYFPNNKGLVAGIITGGFALCSFVFGFIFFGIVNPDGLTQVKNDDGFSYFEGESIEVAQNVPGTLRKMSYMYLGVSVLAALLLLHHPNQIGEEEKRLKQELKKQELEKKIAEEEIKSIQENDNPDQSKINKNFDENCENKSDQQIQNYGNKNKDSQIINKDIEQQLSNKLNTQNQEQKQSQENQQNLQKIVQTQNQENILKSEESQEKQQNKSQDNITQENRNKKISILNKAIQVIELEEQAIKKKIEISQYKDEQIALDVILFKQNVMIDQIEEQKPVQNQNNFNNPNYEIKHYDENYLLHRVIKIDSVSNKIQHTNEFLINEEEQLQKIDNQLTLQENIKQNELNMLDKKFQEIEALAKLGAPSAVVALKQPQLYMSILLGILVIGLGLLANGNYKTMAKDYGFTNDSYQVLVGSLGGAANGLSRPMWATLLDKYTFKQVITVIIVLQTICSFTVQFSYVSEAYFIIWIFIIHMNMGAVLGMWPVLSAQLNGVKVGSQLFGLYWYGFSLAATLQFFLVYALKTTIGFENIYYIYSGQCIIALIIIKVYTFKVDWAKYYQKIQASSPIAVSDSKTNQSEKKEDLVK